MYRVLKLNEATDDEEVDVDVNLDDENLPVDDTEMTNAEVEDEAQDDLDDAIDDDIENEEYAMDKDLDDLRDVLVDLDWKLYMITQGDEDDVYYIIGRINGDTTEMLVSKDNPTTDEMTFDWIELPLSFDQVISGDLVYGKKDEDGNPIRPNHDAIMDFLMTSLEDEDPEKAEEVKEKLDEPDEPDEEVEKVSLDDLGSDESEDEEKEEEDNE